MTKPPLGKVEALLYILQHVTQKRMCQNFDTPSFFQDTRVERNNFNDYLVVLLRFACILSFFSKKRIKLLEIILYLPIEIE